MMTLHFSSTANQISRFFWIRCLFVFFPKKYGGKASELLKCYVLSDRIQSWLSTSSICIRFLWIVMYVLGKGSGVSFFFFFVTFFIVMNSELTYSILSIVGGGWFLGEFPKILVRDQYIKLMHKFLRLYHLISYLIFINNSVESLNNVFPFIVFDLLPIIQ